ncbi:MAG: hypothetical protein IIB82_16615 [Bacteroidetes bacterium]|nr:hypothetical protein [Bacteroidota bacterium]
MKTIKYLLFCFIPITAWTQDTETIHEDFNGDGYTDALSCYYSGGSGFGGRYCELKNGATNEIYEVNTQGCFCQIKNAILIPPVLRKKENKSFLEAIKKNYYLNGKIHLILLYNGSSMRIIPIMNYQTTFISTS